MTDIAEDGDRPILSEDPVEKIDPIEILERAQDHASLAKLLLRTQKVESLDHLIDENYPRDK